MDYQTFIQNQELAKSNQIIPDEEPIPENVYVKVGWYWKFQTGRELTSFIVCTYENCHKVVMNLGYSPEHIKVTVKKVEYAIFEMPSNSRYGNSRVCQLGIKG